MPTGNRTIRLGCVACDRDDKDFINAEELEVCKAEGWTDITEQRSYAEASRIVEFGDPTMSVFDWETHLGICPDCKINS